MTPNSSPHPQRGLTLVEMLVGLGIGSVVILGTVTIILQLTQLQSDQRLASLLNQAYFSGVQLARSATRLKPIVSTPDQNLINCLQANGSTCSQYQQRGEAKVPVDVGTGEPANTSFTFAGQCTANCLVERQMTYQWTCAPVNGADTACQGLRVNVAARALAPATGRALAGVLLKPRQSSFFLNARDFVSPTSLRLTCGTRGTPAIYAINFATAGAQDQCSNFNAGPDCAMPMITFPGGNCLGDQSTGGCGHGFGTIGLYDSQQTCASSAVVGTVPVTTAAAAAAAGSTATQPPGQTWTWQGFVYQSTCNRFGICDGVEWANCTGRDCPAAKIQCYSAQPLGQPQRGVGSTQTTTPTGYNCFMRGASDPWIIH